MMLFSTCVFYVHITDNHLTSLGHEHGAGVADSPPSGMSAVRVLLSRKPCVLEAFICTMYWEYGSSPPTSTSDTTSVLEYRLRRSVTVL